MLHFMIMLFANGVRCKATSNIACLSNIWSVRIVTYLDWKYKLCLINTSKILSIDDNNNEERYPLITINYKSYRLLYLCQSLMCITDHVTKFMKLKIFMHTSSQFVHCLSLWNTLRLMQVMIQQPVPFLGFCTHWQSTKKCRKRFTRN